MTHRTVIALALAGVLSLPALAQTSSSKPSAATPSSTDQQSSSSQPQAAPADQQNSQAQPSAQTQPSKENPETATQKQPLSYERHEGFWGHLNPFARKKYVQRQLTPVRDRVNELDELTAANTKLIKDVDSRATEGIRVASLKANEADQHAVDAGNRAQVAQQTAGQANTHLQSVEKVVGNIDQFQPVSQTEIIFRPGQRALSKKAKDALDDMATPLKDQKGYIIEVQGFSSGRGQEAISSSQAMAQSVVRYLVLNHEIPVYRIYTVGMGNAPMQANADGTKPRRINGGRVEISLLKNGVGDLNTEPISTPSATNQQPQENTTPR
jgi:outer membrane protein OmpA-like peptidoglycan-associated protein